MVDQRLSRQEGRFRHRDGAFCPGLCRPGGSRPRSAEACCPRRQGASVAGGLTAQGEPNMAHDSSVTGGYNVESISAHLRAPRAAAIAGIIFSVLMICSLWLLRLSVPADP